jgi:hypothetical protein
VTEDPFAVLGVAPGADEATLRAARRRLAKEVHPDREGGDTARMERLNAAFDAALARLQPAVVAPPTNGSAPQSTTAPPPRAQGRVAHDVASFTIEALPAEAFEALLIVASWLGEVLVDEPPYQLDVALAEPFDCWCRLDLVPDAGASTVALTLAAFDARPVPDLDAVRDAWVANLNQLGRPDPDP